MRNNHYQKHKERPPPKKKKKKRACERYQNIFEEKKTKGEKRFEIDMKIFLKKKKKAPV